MPAPVGRLSHIVIDCHDPHALARFWSQALDVAVAHEWNQYVMLAPTGKGHPGLAFQRVPEVKQGKNRVHLDLMVTDLDAAEAAVVALGGRRLHENEQDGVQVRVMGDPEGNELCLV